MKKLCLILFSLLISVSSLMALDMNNKEIFDKPLDETSNEFKTVEKAFSDSSMKAFYTQTKYIPKIKKELTSSGTMLLMPGNGMAWLTKKPYESLMVVTKDSVKQQVVGGKVIEQNVSGNTIYLAIAEAMENVFSGRFSLIHNVFETYLVIENDKWYIGLVPLYDDFSSFVSFITISGGENIEKVYMSEVGGNSILYEFTGVEKRELNDEEKAVFSL